MKKRQKLMTDEEWKLIEPFASEAEAAAGQARTTAGAKSSLFGRHPLGFANRGGVAVSTRRVSFALHVLAAIAAVAGARHLAECMAHAAGDTG